MRDPTRKLLAPHDTTLSVAGQYPQLGHRNMAKRLGNQSDRIDANEFEGRRTQDCPTAESHGRARGAKCSPHGACSLLGLLGMIKLRNPSMAAAIVDAFSGGLTEGCLRELQDAAALLRREGFDDLSSWTELANGKRPPPPP